MSATTFDATPVSLAEGGGSERVFTQLVSARRISMCSRFVRRPAASSAAMKTRLARSARSWC